MGMDGEPDRLIGEVEFSQPPMIGVSAEEIIGPFSTSTPEMIDRFRVPI